MIKEACVESLEEAITAEKQGADRIELCADLSNDGLTPSMELMQKACTMLKIPVMIMIRPRAGNFVYSASEIAMMKKSIDQAKIAGADGIVIGLLTAENKIDAENTSSLCKYAYPLPVTFHKAIDELDNPVEGVLKLKGIKGIKRVLTSGGKFTAKEGTEIIKRMMEAAGDELIIMVAGSVTDKNADEIQQLTNAKELHGRKIVGKLS